MRILILILLSCPFLVHAQTADSTVKKDSVFEIFQVSKRAEFKKGGDDGLMKYIAKNLEYPELAKEEGIHGMVLVSFVVDDKGNVVNVETLNKKIGYGLEEAAMKVIRSTSGKWEPATVNGTKVKMKFRQPIRFTLQ